MSRGIQNVDAIAFILELQNRRGHGNAALLFDLHPVGNRGSTILFSLDRTGLRDSSAVQQELFG